MAGKTYANLPNDYSHIGDLFDTHIHQNFNRFKIVGQLPGPTRLDPWEDLAEEAMQIDAQAYIDGILSIAPDSDLPTKEALAEDALARHIAKYKTLRV